MTETQLLIGSLSNDLFRVASLTHRGSHQAAQRFLKEAQRWAGELKKHQVASYIDKLVWDISRQKVDELNLEVAEKHLMYGVLLQNYALHLEK